MCTALRHSQWDSLLISSNERKKRTKMWRVSRTYQIPIPPPFQVFHLIFIEILFFNVFTLSHDENNFWIKYVRRRQQQWIQRTAWNQEDEIGTVFNYYVTQIIKFDRKTWISLAAWKDFFFLTLKWFLDHATLNVSCNNEPNGVTIAHMMII